MQKNATKYTHIFNLTKRQKEILDLLLQGYTSLEQIAEKMFIEKITVRTHLNDIYSKLGIHSLAGLIRYLYEEKLNQLQEENEKLKEYCKQIEELCKQKIVDIFEMDKHIKQIEETNKILYQEKCDLINKNEELNKALDEKYSTKKCWLSFNGGVVDNLLCRNAVKNLMLEVEQLKQENEELKKLNEQLATYYPQENNELLKVKQCLDEIEEICKKSYTTEQQYYYRTSDTILQKIKEVRGEE